MQRSCGIGALLLLVRPAAELCFAVVVALLSLLGGSISLLLAPTAPTVSKVVRSV